MNRKSLLLTFVLAVLAGCAPEVDLEREVAALKEADRAFFQETAETGIDGWVSNFAADGVMFRSGEIVRGQDAIRDLMTPAFTNPTYSLSWEPEFAEVSLAGDLGYTAGRYESRAVAQSGDTLTSTGRYVTIWRKNAEGEWEAVLDIGSPGEGM